MSAEEVAETLGDLAFYDETGQPEGVKYDKLALSLLSVVKVQQQRIAEREKADAERQSLLRRIEMLGETVR